MANFTPSPSATAQSIDTLESLAQDRLNQIADLAHTSLTSGLKPRAALRHILRAALASMNELSAAVETSQVSA